MEPAAITPNESQQAIVDLSLEPADNQRLANLCGQFDEHLKQIEKRLRIQVDRNGSTFRLTGESIACAKAAALLKTLYKETKRGELTPQGIQIYMQDASLDALIQEKPAEPQQSKDTLTLRNKVIKARGNNQKEYLHRITKNDINFGVGPAGTGKTYLGVAAAVDALEQQKVRRILLARPAVEAGERLGFLPGDMAQKIDPYLRPLYDALYEMLGFDYVAKLMERHVIEVAPLAFMRGRTLNDAFVILDEAQNTTEEQMKMFLTRIGFGSTVVVTGDITQTDLPTNRKSGLQHAISILQNVEGISFTFFDQRDVVRHPVVQRVVAAYEAYEDKKGKTTR